MRRDISGWIVAGAVALLALTMGAMQQVASPAGRFQIITDTFDIMIVSKGEEARIAPLKMTLLLDTATGETRRLFYTLDATNKDATSTGRWQAPFTFGTTPPAK